MIPGSGVQALKGRANLWPNSENVLNLRKSSLLPFTFEKNYMHDYDVHEVVTRPFYWYLHC
jgi:hypothetical protein